jgi:hypothetical protein
MARIAGRGTLWFRFLSMFFSETLNFVLSCINYEKLR